MQDLTNHFLSFCIAQDVASLNLNHALIIKEKFNFKINYAIITHTLKINLRIGKNHGTLTR